LSATQTGGPAVLLDGPYTPTHKMNKSTKKPKPRGVWKINPKTRVEKNEKLYSRPAARKKVHNIIKKITWFGES
jgi:hypothetical protein